MKFRYIGTEDGPKEINFHGIPFKKGEVVDVPANKTFSITRTGGKGSSTVKVIDKLKGNRCFEEVKKAPAPAKDKEPAKDKAADAG